MHFEKELLKRLPEYRASGLIDEDSSKKLSEHLKSGLSSKMSIFRKSLYVAGILLILIAICLFVQNVWDELSLNERLAIAFIPLLGSFVIGVFVLIYKKTDNFIGEFAAVTNISSFIVMAMVTSSSLNYNLEDSLLYFVTTCLCLPLIFIFGSGLASIGSLIFSLLYLCLDTNGIMPHYLSIAFVIAVTLINAFYIVRKYSIANIFKVLSAWAFCALLPWVFISINDKILFIHPENKLFLFELLFASACICTMLLFSATKTGAQFGFLKKPHLWVGLIGIVVISSLINSSSFYKYNFENFADKFAVFFKSQALDASFLIAILAILSLGWIFTFLRAIKNQEAPKATFLAALFFPMCFIEAFVSGEKYFTFVVLSNSLMFLTGLGYAWHGIKMRSMIWLNIGLLLIISQGIIRMFTAELHILLRASFFALAGIVLLGVNFYLNKKESKNEIK